MVTLQSAFEDIKKIDPDYVFWTGDSTAHDDPWVSLEEVTETLEQITTMVQESFADKED